MPPPHTTRSAFTRRGGAGLTTGITGSPATGEMAQSIAKAAPANKRRECRAGFFPITVFMFCISFS